MNCKKSFDVLLVAFAIVVFSPIIALIGLGVKVFIGSPVLFRQMRPGINGKPFNIFKFRTMTNKRDADGNLLPDAKRLTKFGSLLRLTSLDELPELFNVLKGDMSLVGPRPLLMRYIGRYTPEQARRHAVKPGITGWAQVNGRNALSWEDKFKMDVWYVDHQTFWLDIKILLMTIKKVLIREGINQAGQATAAEFMPDAKAQRREEK